MLLYVEIRKLKAWLRKILNPYVGRQGDDIELLLRRGKMEPRTSDQAMLTDLVVWMRANVPYRPHNRTIHLLLVSKIVLGCMSATVISHQT